MKTALILAILAVSVVSIVGTSEYYEFIKNPHNLSWAYRFEYNGEILNNYDAEVILPSTKNSVTFYLVNITNTDALTTTYIDIGCEAFASFFPTISGPEVRWESGIAYIAVVAGQPIHAQITLTYTTIEGYSNSLYATDPQTSLGGYTSSPDSPNSEDTGPWYSYGARIRVYRLGS